MDRLTYKTKYGQVVFGCGPYMFSELDGVNSPEVTRQTESVIDSDGQFIVQTYYPSKTITINGYIKSENRTELNALKRQLVCMCDCKTDGLLYYEKGNRTYFTEVIPNSFPEFGDEIQHMTTFSVSLNAYRIYWKKSAETADYVYKRFKNVQTTFTLPCVFTVRKNKNSFTNYGDLPCEFICSIIGISDSEDVSAQTLSNGSQTGFALINSSTGEKLVINHDIAIGETVTVDTANFAITSSVSGNLLHKLQRDCEFFKLAPGESEIEVTNYNLGRNIVARFSFNETYVGV